ncbi:MAG: hypothetical protein WCI22_15150 [Actinomycetota bacterium]
MKRPSANWLAVPFGLLIGFMVSGVPSRTSVPPSVTTTTTMPKITTTTTTATTTTTVAGQTG